MAPFFYKYKSVKNRADAPILNTTICVAGSKSSPYRRAESEIQLAIPLTRASAEWR